jgi:hypothetical protein
MSSIATDQNSQHNIDYLIAQKFFYSRAKKVRNIRIIISTALALFSPILIYICPKLIIKVGVVGGLCCLLTYSLKKLIEDNDIEKASKIQEEFDVDLFKIPWNNVLVGDKISHEEISYAKRKFKGNLFKFKNWYKGISEFPYPLDVLLCQRSNLVWDWRLKKVFSIVIFFVLISYFVLTIVWSFMIDLKLIEYILGLFVPALSGYLIAIDEGIEHYKASVKREELEMKINKLLDLVLKDWRLLGIDKLRQIQDCIFRFRNGPLVPDWFYWIYRDSYEENMKSALDNFKAKLSL